MPLRPWTRANRRGKRPSSAAASGTRPWRSVQPLSAPKVEIMATTAIALPPQVPPKMTLAASAKGLFECASACVGIIPKIAIVATR